MRYLDKELQEIREAGSRLKSLSWRYPIEGSAMSDAAYMRFEPSPSYEPTEESVKILEGLEKICKESKSPALRLAAANALDDAIGFCHMTLNKDAFFSQLRKKMSVLKHLLHFGDDKTSIKAKQELRYLYRNLQEMNDRKIAAYALDYSCLRFFLTELFIHPQQPDK